MGLYGGTYTDLSKLTHTLRLTNTGSFDNLLNGTMVGKNRTSSFDLITFKINQNWDNGVGYDYSICDSNNADYSNSPSNWVESGTGQAWLNGSGVYGTHQV
jgi:hypothetical protein